MMKFFSNKTVLFVALTVVFSLILSTLAAPVFAQTGGGTGATGGSGGGGTGASSLTSNPNPNTIDSVSKVKGVLEKITNWMFTIFITLAAMMIIYAAFIYLTSGGGEEVSKAHKMLLYAAVAIAVATASRGLVALTRNFIETP
jgi:preprotein translocase subunit SecG